MSKNVLICPLLTMMKLINPENHGIEQCVEGDCAWWNSGYNGCAVSHLASAMDDLSSMLSDVSDSIDRVAKKS